MDAGCLTVTKYLLDTNHLSAYLDRHSVLEPRIDAALRAGDRIGVCLPVLFEYRAGIRLGRYYQRNLSRLRASLTLFRVWPLDVETSSEFADLFRECRERGRTMSQFDMTIAALARQHDLVLLSADQDFQAAERLKWENWL